MTTATHPRRSAEEQARLHTILTEVFQQRITFNALLGLRVDSLLPEDVRMSFVMRPDLVGDFTTGRLHGGVTSAVLDAVCGLAVMVAIGEKHAHETALQIAQRFGRIGTIDLRVDYLRQGLAPRFSGRAEITRLGGRVASAQARLSSEDGVLVATAAGAYIVS
jgi:uncharacterized protein (TIGR00369 family)